MIRKNLTTPKIKMFKKNQLKHRMIFFSSFTWFSLYIFFTLLLLLLYSKNAQQFVKFCVWFSERKQKLDWFRKKNFFLRTKIFFQFIFILLWWFPLAHILRRIFFIFKHTNLKKNTDFFIPMCVFCVIDWRHFFSCTLNISTVKNATVCMCGLNTNKDV